ncbi:MAG: fasciclin domain-containing protein, partial [Balneolaceae bacterium]
MKNILSIIIFISSFLLLMGCSDTPVNSDDTDILSEEFNVEAEARAPAPGDLTIADIVVASTDADPAEFTLLLAALEYTGLTGVFTGGEQYTVFAPTDQAFLNLVENLGVDASDPFASIDAELGEGTVFNVLLYHVVEGRRAANSVVPNNPRARDRKITTLLEGATFSVSSGAIITDIAGQDVNIVAADVSASNGIIHVID